MLLDAGEVRNPIGVEVCPLASVRKPPSTDPIGG